MATDPGVGDDNNEVIADRVNGYGDIATARGVGVKNDVGDGLGDCQGHRHLVKPSPPEPAEQVSPYPRHARRDGRGLPASESLPIHAKPSANLPHPPRAPPALRPNVDGSSTDLRVRADRVLWPSAGAPPGMEIG